jgi:hypothetical protein
MFGYEYEVRYVFENGVNVTVLAVCDTPDNARAISEAEQSLSMAGVSFDKGDILEELRVESEKAGQTWHEHYIGGGNAHTPEFCGYCIEALDNSVVV